MDPFAEEFLFQTTRCSGICWTEPELSIRDLKDDTRLKQIYTKKFNQEYRLGFVNLVNRPTHDVSQLMKGEENAGRKRIVSILNEYEPKVVCFIGKISFEKFSQSKDFDFGWQQDIYKSKTLLMHFPIRGRAEVRVRELREMSKILRFSPV